MSNEKENWLDEFAEMDIGGQFLPIANGFKYFFTVFLEEKPAKVQKEWQNKPAGHKFQWKIHYKKLDVQNQAYVDVLTVENQKKLERISNFEKNVDCILELSATATKEFSIFIKENKCTNKTIISMYRTGASNKTEYHFEIIK